MIIPSFINALSKPMPAPGAQAAGADSLPGLDSGGAAKPSAFARMLQQRQNEGAPSPREPSAPREASAPRPEPTSPQSRDAVPAARTPAPNAARAQTANPAKPVTPKKAAETSDAAKGEEKNSTAANTSQEDDNKLLPPTLDPLMAHLAVGQEAAPVTCVVTCLPGTATDKAAVLADPNADGTMLADPKADGTMLATGAAHVGQPDGARTASTLTAATSDRRLRVDSAESHLGTSAVDEPAERAGLLAHLAAGHADNRGALFKSLTASVEKDALRVGSVSDVGAVASAGQSLAAFALSPGASQRLPDAAPTVMVSTPVQAPEFREALATQVSLLAKDGVQQASLQLNPADMGPISVQISMDGTQARVDFAVDSAATRQIIEAGLPELASALREAGLTLSGGGVSQQQPQSAQQEAGTQHRGGGTPGRDEAEPAEAPQRRTVSVATGGLDLYA